MKLEQCGTPPYVDIVKEHATHIPDVKKEVHLDKDTTSYINGCTEGKTQVNKFYHVPSNASHILGCVTQIPQSILFLTSSIQKSTMKFLLVLWSLLMLLLSLQINRQEALWHS